MKCPRGPLRTVCAALVIALFAVSAMAQVQSGNIFGKVLGNDGSALPGVTVTLTGVGAPQTFITDAQGDFRFLNLSPGQYSLKAELAGYGTATRAGVTVNIGRNADVAMTLNPSVSQTITVTAEAPLLDTRRTGTGTTVSQIELDKVPSARDPWVIMQQVPGVLMDRINVGGNESGQQSQFVSKGAGGDTATFSVDGVNTTDMIATGSSSDYYDFGSIEEIQVATGGTDPRIQTPGAQINIVTKRGTNDLSGSARYYLADGAWQSPADPTPEARGLDPSRNPSNVPYLLHANEIDQNREAGFEVGGPIIRDRLWLWGSYADQQIDLLVAQSDPRVLPVGADPNVRYTDKTTLETLNFKLNAQITRNNSATAFYSDNDKVKLGRNAGPARPPDTTWNQGGFGPKGTYKVEDTHIFSSNFYLTGMYSKVNGGFGLWANAGADCKDMDCAMAHQEKSWVIDWANQVNRNNFLSTQGERPQEQTRLDGSAFFNTGGLSHELKFGFGYRNASTKGLTFYPNNQVFLDFSEFAPAGAPRCTSLASAEVGACKGIGVAYFYSIGPQNYEYKYQDAYVGDTMLWGNLTLQAGLRFDNQKGEAGDQTSPGNNVFRLPDGTQIIRAQSVRGSDIDTMTWEDISPRIGLTYALGSEKKTLLRAAYNRYVQQMGSNSAGYTAAVFGNYAYGGVYGVDLNNNDIIEGNELDWAYTGGQILGPVGFNPNDFTRPFKTVRVDPNVKSPSTSEYILGFEHELMRDFVVGLNYTHRDFDNFIWNRPEKHQGQGDWYTTADYIQLGTLTRPSTVFEVDPYTVPYYDVKPEVGLPIFFMLTNRDGYTQEYDGLEASLVKRMANRWLFRGNFSWNDWNASVEPEAIIDPTHARNALGCSVCDGADVVQGSGTISGAKGAVWINSEWAVNASALYQIPVVEANLGVSFTMRQGYPILYVHESPILPVAAVRRQVLVTDNVTEHRLDNPYSVDLRLAKEFRFRGVGLELAVDAFNVTNNRVVLQRNADLARQTARRAAANRIREYQSPRIFRVGARLTF
jgi:hypothetical protein